MSVRYRSSAQTAAGLDKSAEETKARYQTECEHEFSIVWRPWWAVLLLRLPSRVWAAPTDLVQAVHAVEAWTQQLPEELHGSTLPTREGPAAGSVEQSSPRFYSPHLPFEGPEHTVFEEDWLGVTVFAPHYQQRAYALQIDEEQGVPGLLSRVMQHESRCRLGFSSIVPAVPQSFTGSAMLVLCPTVPEPGIQATVVLDLTRVGGRIYADLLPVAIRVVDVLDKIANQLR